MAFLPEPKIRCPKCHSTIMDVNPKWIAEAAAKNKKHGTPPFKVLFKIVLKEFRSVGKLKRWMIWGECPEKECDGKWYDKGKMSIAVPHHLKEVKAHG